MFDCSSSAHKRGNANIQAGVGVNDFLKLITHF